MGFDTSNPVWAQLYAPKAAVPPQQAPQTSPPAPPAPHYLEFVQSAAAAGGTFNLADLAGFETHMDSDAE